MATPLKSKSKVKDPRGKKAGTPTKPEGTSGYTSSSIWLQRYNKAASNQTEMFDRFSKWYDLLYAVVDTKNFAPWRSKVFVPLLAAKTWTMISKFTTIKPGWQVIVRDTYTEEEEEKQKRQDKAQKKLEYDYENPDLDMPISDKVVTCLTDAVVTGTGLGKVPWNFKKKQRREHLINEDGTFDFSQDVVYESVYGCNDVIPVNIFNVFMAPSATSLYQSPWVIIREFKTISDLKATNEAYGGNFYKNLGKLSEDTTVSDQYAQYNKARNRMTNEQDKIAADNTIGQVEIFECYEKSTNTICTYANAPTEDGESRAWLPIRESKNIYWHGKYPLVAFYVKRRPYEFWGEGIFEVSHRLQSAANDLFNHYLDNWNLSIDGMLMADQNSNIAEFTVEPGGLIEYSGERPAQFKFPEPSPAQLSVVMQEIQKNIEENTISQYAAGNPNSQMDKTAGTATGIIRIQEAANDVISFMRRNFQQSILQIGRFFLSNNQQFLADEVNIPLMQKNKLVMEPVGPHDLHGELDVSLDDSTMQPMSKAELRENSLAFLSQLIQLQSASIQQSQLTQGAVPPVILDINKVIEDLARHFGQRGADQYLVSEAEMQPPQVPEEDVALEEMNAYGA